MYHMIGRFCRIDVNDNAFECMIMADAKLRCCVSQVAATRWEVVR